VLDERGDFATRCIYNANVDLDPLGDEADVDFVKSQIEQHVEYTRSPKGQWVLEHWGQMAPKFIKIFPRELKKALAESGAKLTEA
jgi:glutamate synthase (ferredoxin)